MNIIFDIDGTIWDTTEVVSKAWNQAVREAAIPKLDNLYITADMLKKEFGKPMDVIADDLFGNIDPKAKDKLLKRCCELEQKEICECTDDLTYKGMFECVKALSKKHDLFVVSNCQDGYIELVLEKNKMQSFFKDTECFGRTGLSKAENIKLVMRRNNISEAYYFGDTLGDYNSAREAGVKFIYASYGFGEVLSPDYIVSSYDELMALSDRL